MFFYIFFLLNFKWHSLRHRHGCVVKKLASQSIYLVNELLDQKMKNMCCVHLYAYMWIYMHMHTILTSNRLLHPLHLLISLPFCFSFPILPHIHLVPWPHVFLFLSRHPVLSYFHIPQLYPNSVEESDLLSTWWSYQCRCNKQSKKKRETHPVHCVNVRKGIKL